MPDDNPMNEMSALRQLRVVGSMGPWGFFDTVGHLLHLPGFLQRHLCDRFDRSLGVEEGNDTR